MAETPFIWSENPPFPDEINVREEVARCIQDRGHYAFWRKARPQRSPSWQDGRSEASHDDPFNQTTGHLYDDFLIKIRKRPTVDSQAGPSREIRSDIGLVGPRRYIIYLTHPVLPELPDLLPTINDQIIEVTLDEETGLPKRAWNIERVYDVHFTHEYRDQKGRIEYWLLLVQQKVWGK